MLIKQIYQKNVIFVTIGFKYEKYLCNSCHDLIQKRLRAQARDKYRYLSEEEKNNKKE